MTNNRKLGKPSEQTAAEEEAPAPGESTDLEAAAITPELELDTIAQAEAIAVTPPTPALVEHVLTVDQPPAETIQQLVDDLANVALHGYSEYCKNHGLDQCVICGVEPRHDLDGARLCPFRRSDCPHVA
jgi:hypothetical protein